MVAPDCFNSFFYLNSTVHCHSTRQSTRGDLFLANINTSQYGLQSIRYLGAKLWNELPITIRTSPSKFAFTKSLKLHFLNAMKLLWNCHYDLIFFKCKFLNISYANAKKGDPLLVS